MLISVPNGKGPPIELVRVEQQGCRGCVVADAIFPGLHCGNTPCMEADADGGHHSYVIMLATPENLARAVLQRMDRDASNT